MSRSSHNKKNSEDEEVMICLKMNSSNVNKSMDFKIKSAVTIGDIKSLFCQDLSSTANSRELYLNGERLDDHKRVADCGIRNGSVLHLMVNDLAWLKLLVVIPSLRKQIPVRMRSCYPIKFVKDRIQHFEGIKPDEYKLLYAGREIEEDRPISSLGICHGSVLHLISNPRDKFTVFVGLPFAETVCFMVRPLYSVSDVKAIISSLKGIPVDDYNVVYNGLKLHDSKTLAYYEIKERDILTLDIERSNTIGGKWLKGHKRVADCGNWNGPTLNLTVKDRVGLNLLVVIPSLGETILVRVMTNYSIKFVKDRIQHFEGVNPDEFTLWYGGKKLDEDGPISSLGIPDGSILHLISNPKEKFSVFVDMPTGETVSLKVQLLYSVSDVKAIVSSLRGMQLDDYNLVYNGLRLHNSKTLAYYEIEDGSTLWLSSQQYQIFVKAGSKTLTLVVDPSDIIGDVQTKILQKLGIPSGTCSLVTYFGGKRLQECHDLGYYNIQKDATVNTVLRCKESQV